LERECPCDFAGEFSGRRERAGLRRDTARTGAHRFATLAKVSSIVDNPILPLQGRALNQTPRGIVQLPEQTLQNIKRIGDDN
jgi:hypothetical protein